MPCVCARVYLCVCVCVCVCVTSLRMYIEGRAGPGGAVRGGAEQGKAEQVRARQGRAGQGRAESESELLLVTRPNDSHSPGPVIREVSP